MAMISTLSVTAFSQHHLDLIPLPVQIEPREGIFCLQPESRIFVVSDAAESAHYLASILRKATSYILPVVSVDDPESQSSSADIVLDLIDNNINIPSEGYQLTVDTHNVKMVAADEAGLFYAVQTLLQLFPATIYSGNITGWERWEIPCLQITDYPRFGHRGMMLDVSRQFYDTATVKKYLDWMSMHKLNVFHWHLTDDNGWRIEIKKYPKLTELGAWRGPDEVLPPSYGSGNKRYGGFYTQQEIKDIVEYAQKRHIRIIPEVELPGHAKAAVACYPEIKCESNDLSLSVNGENLNLWCVAREDNYTMIDHIIGEVASLFPGEYIHIGGDEVNPAPWRVCPHCQALMANEGYSDIMDLQTYFVKRVEQIVEKHGKKMMGWDEVADRGTLSPHTAVTAWRNVQKGMDAIQKGVSVVFQPGSYTYLDMKQSPQERGHSWAGIVTMERTYSLDPVGTAELGTKEASLLLGVQAGLWGELLDRPHRFPEYQLYPRLCALAELAWTPQALRSWEAFDTRIGRTHFDRLYEMGIAFRVPPPIVTYSDGKISVTPPFPWSVVRYQGDKMDPNTFSPIVHGPVVTQEPSTYRFATFYRDRYVSPVVAGAQKKYQSPATTVEASFALQPGSSFEYITDYKENTYVRSIGPLKKDDFLVYRFKEALDCEIITIYTGIPNIPIYYVESGYVAYSIDGENFIKVGDLEYGCLTFTPPKGIRAVKVVAGDENYSVQNAFTDLLIE